MVRDSQFSLTWEVEWSNPDEGSRESRRKFLPDFTQFSVASLAITEHAKISPEGSLLSPTK